MTDDSGVNKPIKRRTFLAGTAAATAFAAFPMPFVQRANAQEFTDKELRVLTWSDATGQAAVNNILRLLSGRPGQRHPGPYRHYLRHDCQNQGVGEQTAI